MKPTALVWVGISALIGLICFTQLDSILHPQGVAEDKARFLRLIAELGEEYNATPEKDRAQFNAQAMERLSQFEAKTKGTAGSMARVKLILTQTINPSAQPEFGNLNAETDDITEKENRQQVAETRKKLNTALIRLYSAKSLTGSQAEEISSDIRTHSPSGWPFSLALRRVSELAAEPQRANNKLNWVNLMSFAFLISGGFCWAIYFSARARNQLKPVGTPLKNEPREVGDSFGARFLIYLMMFGTFPAFVGPALVPVLGEVWGRSAGGWIASCLCLLLVVVPIFDVPSSFAKIGIGRSNLGLNMMWGFAGFLANLPILIVAGVLGETFFKWIPTSEHPAIQSLSDPGMVAPTIISAVLMAAVAEEIFFRGCLFQGILVRLKSPVWAVLLSSLAFAAVHPQGGGAWLGLGFIGAMGAMLFHQTGSLIPAMVMHGLNNLFAITVALTSR